MKPGKKYLSLALFFILAWILGGCTEDFREGIINEPPEVWLSSGPVEGDTTCYQVHFYWGGLDPDGEVSHFEYVMVEGDPIGFHADDITGLDKWTRTTLHDGVFIVRADSSPRPVHNGLYTRYDRTHTFFIRAVDMKGLRSAAAHRSFTAWTLAPTVIILKPRLTGGRQIYPQIIVFEWDGRDPIDIPSNTQAPESVRYLWCRHRPEIIPDIVRDLNENFRKYEDMFSPWIHWDAPDGSGRKMILGDDEALEPGKNYIFAVQAKDEAGAVTAIFERDRNVRLFSVSEKIGPTITICEPYLDCYEFPPAAVSGEAIGLPPGVPLHFSWEADADGYGGEIAGYRYGWDIEDLGNDDDWPVRFSPFHRDAPVRKLYSGIHTFYVEAVDDAGINVIGQIQIEIISFTMERNLLWVDDYYGSPTQSPLYERPSESNHDQFWRDICSRAAGFNQDRDVYNCVEHNLRAPDITFIGKYKNIIWTYDSRECAWSGIVHFTGEDQIGMPRPSPGAAQLNYLPVFLSKGGHLWTEGFSEKGGGLAAVLDPGDQVFPALLKTEPLYPREKNYENSMACKDYCVTVIDKVMGPFRNDAPVPYRNSDRDAMRYAYRDDADRVTYEHPGLPHRLDLWEEVTREGRFFDPRSRGFYYVEIYDPRYWMDFNLSRSQDCFHPMYRMRTVNALSAVDRTAVVIWVTKYERMIPAVSSGVAVAAPSVHFGFPLWFFDRAAVDGIVDVVFDEWRIRGTD